MKDDSNHAAAVQSPGEASSMLDGELSKKCLSYVRRCTDKVAPLAHHTYHKEIGSNERNGPHRQHWKQVTAVTSATSRWALLGPPPPVSVRSIGPGDPPSARPYFFRFSIALSCQNLSNAQ